MLRSLNYLEQYMVIATDGDVGNVVDFQFDDEYWTIRYLVVDTGAFLNRHDVLVSPSSFSEVEEPIQRFHLNLTKDKVKNSPTIDKYQPISRQQEQEFNKYYGHPRYWKADTLDRPAPHSQSAPTIEGSRGDIHLRSAKEVRGYNIQASDDSIGHIDDYIVNDENWEIRYLVIDTSNWWLGKRVLVAPQWASQVNWEQRSVHVNMSRQAIKDGPEYDSSVTLNREYETELHSHFGEQGYWDKSNKRDKSVHR